MIFASLCWAADCYRRGKKKTNPGRGEALTKPEFRNMALLRQK